MFSACLAHLAPHSFEKKTSKSYCLDKVEGYTVEALVHRVKTGSVEQRRMALDSLEELMREAPQLLTGALTETKALSVLIDCLDAANDAATQFAALAIFANMTSGTKEQSQVVVNRGAIVPFVRCIDSSLITIAEQAIICVGNLACEDALNRKVLYDNGGLHAVVRFLNRGDLTPEQLNSGVWAFSNLCRSRSLISMDFLESCVHVVKRLAQLDDSEILRSACVASVYLTDGPSDRIQVFINNKVCPFIIRLIHHEDPIVVFAALRAVSNFLSGSDEQIEALIDLDVVSSLSEVLKRHKERRMIKEACRALSNVAAGSQGEIEKIVEANLVGQLLHAARHAPNDVRIEATWVIGNAIVGSGHGLIREFLTPECMKVLSSALTFQNPDIVKLALEALRNFLWCGDFGEDPNFDLSTWDSENDEDFWEHAEWLSNAHGFHRLAKLREHPDVEISSIALMLLEALIEDPHAQYLDEEVPDLYDSEEEEDIYEDILSSIAAAHI